MKFFSYINSFCEIARNRLRLRLCCMQDSRMSDTGRSLVLSARVCLHTEARPHLHFRICRSVECFQSCQRFSIIMQLLQVARELH